MASQHVSENNQGYQWDENEQQRRHFLQCCDYSSNKKNEKRDGVTIRTHSIHLVIH